MVTGHCVKHSLSFIRTIAMSKVRINRSFVPSEKKDWSVPWPDYQPIRLQLEKGIAGQPFADPDIGTAGFTPLFNQKDGPVDRRSHTGHYLVSEDGYPLCPLGRTGACLRSRLGRWGPNHAADPIVTRWTKGQDGEERVLVVVLIQRRDCGSWSLPGGMVDVGEDTKATASREFMEEATDILSLSKEQKQRLEQKLRPMFESGVRVWEGIVESDGRNTDNGWMESVAYHFHDEDGVLSDVTLKSGDDATGVACFSVNDSLKKIMTGTHLQMVRKAAERLNVIC